MVNLCREIDGLSFIAYLLVSKPRQQLFIIVTDMCGRGRKIGVGGQAIGIRITRRRLSRCQLLLVGPH
jgi:hypothetical protein